MHATYLGATTYYYGASKAQTPIYLLHNIDITLKCAIATLIMYNAIRGGFIYRFGEEYKVQWGRKAFCPSL